MMKRLAWIPLLVVMILILFASGCSAGKNKGLLGQIKERGTIRIGTEGTYKPFSFHDAQEVARRIGVKAEFVEIPWDGMLTSLQTGKIDMVANQVGVKPERLKKFDFSEPYTVSYAQIVVHKDNQEIKGLAQLKGKKAGQTPTSNFGQMAAKAGAEILAYEDMMSAMRDVAAKRIDFSLNDRLAIAEMLKTTHLPLKTVGEPMERTVSAFPVRKGNPELVKEINRALDSMRKDGTLAQISMKWFGQDVTK
jgi:cystine transport system substrate-binding protein